MIDFLKRTAKTALGAVAPIQSQLAGLASSFGSAANAQKKASDQKAKTAAASTVATSPNIVKPAGPIRPPASATDYYGSSSMFEVPSVKSSGVTTRPNIAVQAPAKPVATPPKPPQNSGFASSDPNVMRQVQAMQNVASGSTSIPSAPLSTFSTPSSRSLSSGTTAASPSVPVPSQSVSAPMQSQTSAAPKINEQLKALRDTLLSTYATTPEEQQARDALSKIIAQQANLAASEQSGLAQIADQPIVLGLIRGQEQALQRQAATQQGALAAQAIPLEQQLANLQASREMQRLRAKEELGFVESDEERALREQEMAAKAMGEGFTLGEGQMRYDAQGNLIAAGPEKTVSQSQPATVQEYQFARENGFVGSFLDYQRAKDQAQSSSAPSSYREWQLAGSPGSYADWVRSSSGKPPTEAQSRAATFAARLTNSLPTIDQLGSKFTGILSKISPVEWLKSEDRKLFEQAEADFINATLRRESGAAIAPSEFENARRQYIPQVGDTDAVLAQKKANRDIILQGMQKEAGSASFTPAGFGASQATPSIQSLRQQFPQFNDLPDDVLLEAAGFPMP